MQWDSKRNDTLRKVANILYERTILRVAGRENNITFNQNIKYNFS